MSENSAANAGEFAAWLEQRRAAFENALSTHLKSGRAGFSPHSRLGDAVLYSLGIGGKRLRPILVLESCRACGGDDARALNAAIAIECVHTFSLVHDDLPAMDDDDFRRGKPANHKVFSEALAILAGDWLLAHAIGLVATELQPLRADRSVSAGALVQTLTRGTLGMIEGQAADIAGESRPGDADLVDFIHLHKTASLIEASARLGALCAGATAERVDALGRFGLHLGLAFQIVDDLLDATGSSEKLGKRAAKDAERSKQTYPAVFGIERSQERAAEEVAAAKKALAGFGDAANNLRRLADFVAARDH